MSNDKFETLDWPLDYPISDIYECLESKGFSNLPTPEITYSEIQIKFDEMPTNFEVIAMKIHEIVVKRQ